MLYCSIYVLNYIEQHYKLINYHNSLSGKIAEDKMKELLNVYRVKFHNQHEIFKPPSTIANFIENVENLLGDNDLHMIISRQQQEIAELKLRVCEMEKKNLELQLQVR